MKQQHDKLAKRQQQKFSWTVDEFKAALPQNDSPKSKPTKPTKPIVPSK